jgi:sortase A
MTRSVLARVDAHRLVRAVGLALTIFGTGAVLWGLTVWLWQDPFTGLYTRYEQRQLAHAYAKRLREFRPVTLRLQRHAVAAAASAAPVAAKAAKARRVRAERVAVRQAAQRYRLASHDGDALGRIVVPRLGLRMILVDGTSSSSLERGPGRDLRTLLPGEGGLVYIAGHRTTYLAPFSHIDSLRPGDRITIELPYGTFVYSVTGHVIVSADDLAVLRPRDREVLALQACNPRFFATQRYIVYARPTEVLPASAPAYRPADDRA